MTFDTFLILGNMSTYSNYFRILGLKIRKLRIYFIKYHLTLKE